MGGYVKKCLDRSSRELDRESPATGEGSEEGSSTLDGSTAFFRGKRGEEKGVSCGSGTSSSSGGGG